MFKVQDHTKEIPLKFFFHSLLLQNKILILSYFTGASTVAKEIKEGSGTSMEKISRVVK